MIRHIWFDMGGTLYQETPAFEILHDKLRYEAYAAIAGVPLEQAAHEYAELYARYGSNSAVFTSLGKPSDFWQRTFDNLDLASVLKPDPAVSAALVTLSSHVPVSLFTNFKQSKISAVLKLLNIDEHLFTYRLSGDDVAKRKPDSEGFEKMVALSALSPEELVYVGDRIDVDIKPAKAVGMQTALLWQKSDEADYSAGNITQLVHILLSNLAK